jgi:hypothetical protein
MINADITIQPHRRLLAIGWIKYRRHQHNTLNVQGSAQTSLDVVGALVIDEPTALPATQPDRSPGIIPPAAPSLEG